MRDLTPGPRPHRPGIIRASGPRAVRWASRRSQAIRNPVMSVRGITAPLGALAPLVPAGPARAFDHLRVAQDLHPLLLHRPRPRAVLSSGTASLPSPIASSPRGGVGYTLTKDERGRLSKQTPERQERKREDDSQGGRRSPHRPANPPPARHRPGARSARPERCPLIGSRTSSLSFPEGVSP